MTVINRVLSEDFLESFKTDFANLIRIVNVSQGELDLAIRKNYLNLYYKGNSLAKISPKGLNQYLVEIHHKFFSGTRADNPEFYVDKKESGSYVRVILDAGKPPLRFLQKAHINQFCRKVNKVNYGEEIVFEQALITDNLDREDLIIIDRQIMDKARFGRIDLLALEQIHPEENRYRFLVIEVKLGNNPELNGKVAKQLKRYLDHIEEHINDFVACYQEQYAQKKELDIIGAIPYSRIVIQPEAHAIVVVSGYSKIAEPRIAVLEKDYPEIEVKKFVYRL